MENFDLILEVGNVMMYESRDEKNLPPPCREKDIKKPHGRGARQQPNVAVVAEAVLRQQTSHSGDRYRDSLLG